jgi:pilus assembly protein CpaE
MAHILVIDDDQDILRLLEFTLKRAGHIVTIARDGVEGLAQVETLKPAAVICDVMMPKMNGYEFCRRVRAKPEIQAIPIIVFSARFQPIDKQTALDAGATDYLPKSVSPDVLNERIDELLSATGGPPTARGIMGIFSLRGGVGVTTLAVNLAVGVALAHKTKVTLVDMAEFGGHVALMLGLRPTSHVAGLLDSLQGNFSRERVQPHLMAHSAGIQVLASLPTFEETPLPAEHLLPFMRHLKSTTPVVILDLPGALAPGVSPILSLLDKMIVLLSPDIPSLQSTATALQGLLKLGVPDQAIKLVVNQVNPHQALPVETIEKTLKRPILVSIPFEAEMVRAVNSGKPLLLSYPKSPGAMALGKLAVTILT